MSCISVKDKKRLKEKRVTFSHPLTKQETFQYEQIIYKSNLFRYNNFWVKRIFLKIQLSIKKTIPKGSKNKITTEVKEQLQNLIDSYTPLSCCIKNYFLYLMIPSYKGLAKQASPKAMPTKASPHSCFFIESITK